LGWSDTGYAGSDLYETPHLDRLAQQGLRFSQAYSACTVCSPTRAALLSGKYPARLHLTDWIHGHARPFAKLKIPAWTEHLPEEETTLAAALRPLGYTSASIGKWHLGDEPADMPERRGFDVNIAGTGQGQPPSYFAPYHIPTLVEGPAGEYLTDRLTDEACRFVREHRAGPFFLYLPHFAVHTPLQAKSELVEHFRAKLKPGMKHTNAVYAAMQKSVDDSVGRLLTELESTPAARETLVIFTSDNGGLIGPTSNVPCRAGKGSAYEGGVRVPLIVWWAGHAKPGSICPEPVISQDLFATILAAAGEEVVAKRPDVDGLSLLPLVTDPAASLKREAIYWHYPHYHPGGATPYGAIRAGNMKLVEFFEDLHVELYDLDADPSETRDLAKEQPERTKELRDRLTTWRERVGAQMPTPNPNYDPLKDAPPKRAKPAKKPPV